MATLIAYQNGDFTGSTTWKTVETATNAQQTDFSSNTSTTTSYVLSSTFTVTNGQVIEGLLLHCSRITTSGTVSVALSDDNGVTATREVVVNAADLPTYQSWVFFKFASTLTGDGGTDYRVMVKSSVAANARFHRNITAGNWSRLLRRATTATAAGTDVLYISAELTGAGAKTDITVTMNQTSSATTYGAINIGHAGTLSYGVAESTNYYLKTAGILTVRGGGTFNMGTVASPIPRSSTARLEFACLSAGQYGLEVQSGGTFTAQGLSRTIGKNIYYCLLNTDESAGSTSLGVDTDTGWLDNDEICISATGSSTTQHENGLLNGNAGAATLTVDGFVGAGGGLQYAHLGTAPRQAEVALLTRNVRIHGSGSTNVTYISFASATTVDMDWVQMYWMGANIANKGGILFSDGTSSTASIQYCSISYAVTTSTQAVVSCGSVPPQNFVFSNNVIYSVTVGTPSVFLGTPSATPVTLQNNIIISGCGMFPNYYNCSVDNNRISGGLYGLRFSSATSPVTSCSGNVVHNTSAKGIEFLNGASGTVQGGAFWHINPTGGSTLGAHGAVTTDSTNTATMTGTVTFNNVDFFGNGYAHVNIGIGGNFTFSNCTFGGTSTVSSPRGVLYVRCKSIRLDSCTFRTTSGIYTAHTTADIQVGLASTASCAGKVTANNCLFGGATEVLVFNEGLKLGDAIYSQRHDQSTGVHKVFKRYGIVSSDSVIYRSSSPSERITPSSATNRVQSGKKSVTAAASTAKTVKVWVRESVAGDGTDYDGLRARLVVRRNDSAGITADTVLATATASSEGAWQELSGTTQTVGENTVLEFFVDCAGTTGWVNIDDWSVV